MPSSSKNGDDDEKKSSWTYDGSEDDWDSFDRRIMRYMRKKYGSFGEKLWQGDLRNFTLLLGQDFSDYCEEVWDAIELHDSTRAKEYWPTTSGFWTKKFQGKWRKRQYVLLKDHIEEHARGNAEVAVVNFDGDPENIRQHLYKQFGSGSGGDIHTKEAEYEAGLPEHGKAAFPPNVDMKEKLRKLETRRRYFFNMCKPEKRKTYVFCWESKLVRIVLDHVNSDYKGCVARLLDKVQLQKQIKKVQEDSRAAADGGSEDGGAAGATRNVNEEVTDLADALDRSFNNDWLPSWSQLRSALVDEYVTLEKDRKSGNAKGNTKLPIAAFTQGVRCYGCGEAGHKKGAAECKADRNAIHSSAPSDYKQMKLAKRKKGSENSPGSSAGGIVPMSSKPCYQFDFGKGNCRFGAKCKFSHSKSGGGGGGGGGGSGGGGKFNPSQKKTISTMVATSLKKIIKNAADKQGKKRKADEYEGDGEGQDLQALIASLMMLPVKNTIPRILANPTIPAMSSQLHDVKNSIGVDSDGAVSCSMNRDDFPLWLDTSPEARGSIPAPSGIGGCGLTVGGIGPLLCRAKSGEYFLDPEGVFLIGNGPKFRILAAQRFKAFGVRLVGCFEDTDKDVWQDRRSHHTVELAEEGPPMKKILVLKTQPVPNIPVNKQMKELVNEIRKGNRSGMITLDDFESEKAPGSGKPLDESVGIGMTIMTMLFAILMATTKGTFNTTNMIFNEAKVTVEERTRLYSRRFGFADPAYLSRMHTMAEYGKFPKLVHLNEDNPGQDAAKFRQRPYKRREGVPEKPCWHKAYVDGYGGGSSLGGDSYEGAVGGYLFVCPSTGDYVHKLYASHEQFPAALFQFLSQVEAEGHVCYGLYCDTYIVNESAEAEAVAALFHCAIVPVSNGSPQEVAFVETAHRVVGQRSRAMMINAPHLPPWCWALADKYAVYTGRFLPQSTRNWLCSYYLNTGKVPNWRALCLHVFGAPCRYAPPLGPVHKRAQVTEEGYFVGVQHPMALVIRKSDMKLVSVSTKKIIVYESAYCSPLAKELSFEEIQAYEHAEVRSAEDDRVKSVEEMNGVKGKSDTQYIDHAQPKAVHSVKSMRAHNIPSVLGDLPNQIRPPTTLDASADTQSPDPGEGEYIPEHRVYSTKDQLTADILELKTKVEKGVSEPAIRAKIVAELVKAANATGGVIEKGELKRGKGKVGTKKARLDQEINIDEVNVIHGKRVRRAVKGSESQTGAVIGNKKQSTNVKHNKGCSTKKISRAAIAIGDLVSAPSSLFDGEIPGSYSKNNPDRCWGVVTKVLKRGALLQVTWTKDNVKFEVLAADVRVEKKKLTCSAILSVLITEGKVVAYESADKSNWPTDFFHALVQSDWRKWVEAVKKEIDSWLDFNTYTTIPIEQKKPGASIVPLGELYTRKRDDSYKFRQYLLGNLLKRGKDFTETFSSTVSWDGIRWCASVACATNKQIYGLDAVTGFLQASEQMDLYAYLPSHGEYSSMSYEELALFRAKLLDMVEKEGEQGLKQFARNHKRASRDNPKTCYKLNQCVYGSPSANHEFEMLFQAAHIGGTNKESGEHTKGCGLTLSPKLNRQFMSRFWSIIKTWWSTG